MNSDEAIATPAVPRAGWLNRTTVGVSLASLFSDVSHELATAVLPAFLVALGAGPAVLGWIEGSADGLSALAKLWGGVAADRVGRRKPLASVGYLVTAMGTAGIGLCTAAWQVMACRVVAWIGRGSRSPARDVLMAEGAAAEVHGRAFGMERAGDAAGAVLGPSLAMFLLAQGVEPRHLMLVSLAPGFPGFPFDGLARRRTAPRSPTGQLQPSRGAGGDRAPVSEVSRRHPGLRVRRLSRAPSSSSTPPSTSPGPSSR